jgi:hypothetical protein
MEKMKTLEQEENMKQTRKFGKVRNMINFLNNEEQVELGLYLMLQNKIKANYLLSNKIPSCLKSENENKDEFMSKGAFEKRKAELLSFVQRLDYNGVKSFLQKKN